MKIVEELDGNECRTQQIHFEGEPGVEVPAKRYIPNTAGRTSAVVMLNETRLAVPLHVTRRPSTASLAGAIARAGRVVMELRPRDSSSANAGKPFPGNRLTNEQADLVGRNLAAIREHDILGAVDVLATRG